MTNISEMFQSKIKNLPGIVDLTDDYQAALPEIKVKIDKERAALLGLDAYLIGQIIKAAVNGMEVGKYREGDDEFDITGRLPVNPSGGIQCKGEPPGASGLGQVCEIVWQMRGQAGDRQISKANVGLCQVFGWNHIAAVSILKK